MNKIELNNDNLEHIILYLNCELKLLLINNFFNKIIKIKFIKKIIILQKWWKYYKLPYDSPNYDLVTKNTLIRYYIAKYKIEWLQKFPQFSISKLRLTLDNTDIDKYYNQPSYNITNYFRNFCNKYIKNKSDLLYIGW